MTEDGIQIMRKCLAGLIAGLMVLTMTTACKIEIDSNDVTPVAKTYRTSDIVRPDGTILIQDFDITTVTQFLDEVNEVKDYHIIINTGGGNAFNITTMINRIRYLQSNGAHFVTEIIGYGMSAGTYLFAVGDSRIVHEGAVLMTHGAGMVSYGVRTGRKEVCKEVDGKPEYPDQCKLFTLLDENFIEILKENTTLTDEEIEYWMYNSSYNFMSAEEAFECGLATEII